MPKYGPPCWRPLPHAIFGTTLFFCVKESFSHILNITALTMIQICARWLRAPTLSDGGRSWIRCRIRLKVLCLARSGRLFVRYFTLTAGQGQSLILNQVSRRFTWKYLDRACGISSCNLPPLPYDLYLCKSSVVVMRLMAHCDTSGVAITATSCTGRGTSEP